MLLLPLSLGPRWQKLAIVNGPVDTDLFSQCIQALYARFRTKYELVALRERQNSLFGGYDVFFDRERVQSEPQLYVIVEALVHFFTAHYVTLFYFTIPKDVLSASEHGVIIPLDLETLKRNQNKSLGHIMEQAFVCDRTQRICTFGEKDWQEGMKQDILYTALRESTSWETPLGKAFYAHSIAPHLPTVACDPVSLLPWTPVASSPATNNSVATEGFLDAPFQWGFGVQEEEVDRMEILLQEASAIAEERKKVPVTTSEEWKNFVPAFPINPNDSRCSKCAERVAVTKAMPCGHFGYCGDCYGEVIDTIYIRNCRVCLQNVNEVAHEVIERGPVEHDLQNFEIINDGEEW